MSIGEELLISILKAKDDQTLSLIEKKMLDMGEAKKFTYISDYYKTNGELPKVRAFCDKFSLDSSAVGGKPKYYLKQIKDRFIYSTISDKVPTMLKSLRDDPRKELGNLQSLVSMLAVDAVESVDSLYSDSAQERLRAYKERKTCKGVTYLSMGNHDLDTMFFGYRKHDLITIGGRAGQGKTWLLVYLTTLLEVVLQRKADEGETFGDILFISNEMGTDEISERIDCIKFRLPYQAFLSGTLDKKAEERYMMGLKKMRSKKVKSHIRLVENCSTIDELTTYIGLYHPSVVFIDGSYLMEPKLQEGWEKIVFVTRNLKRLAKNFQVPIINTTQLKRGALKTGSKFALDGQDDFAYSSSYSQDSDIAIRMFQDADMKFHDIVGCEVVKGRRVVSGAKFVFQNDLLKMLQSITIPEEDSDESEKISY